MRHNPRKARPSKRKCFLAGSGGPKQVQLQGGRNDNSRSSSMKQLSKQTCRSRRVDLQVWEIASSGDEHAPGPMADAPTAGQPAEPFPKAAPGSQQAHVDLSVSGSIFAGFRACVMLLCMVLSISRWMTTNVSGRC